MEIWIDTVDVAAIAKFQELGILSGVTCNPNILVSSKKNPDRTIEEILALAPKRFAIQITRPDDVKASCEQARKLHKLSRSIIVKVPTTLTGLKIMAVLRSEGIPTLATAIYHPIQVLYAIEAGAEYLAPYLAKFEETGRDWRDALHQMNAIAACSGKGAKIMAAAIHSQAMIEVVAKSGTASITIPYPLIETAFAAPEVPAALARFETSWREASYTQESRIFI